MSYRLLSVLDSGNSFLWLLTLSSEDQNSQMQNLDIYIKREYLKVCAGKSETNLDFNFYNLVNYRCIIIYCKACMSFDLARRPSYFAGFRNTINYRLQHGEIIYRLAYNECYRVYPPYTEHRLHSYLLIMQRYVIQD